MIFEKRTAFPESPMTCNSLGAYLGERIIFFVITIIYTITRDYHGMVMVLWSV